MPSPPSARSLRRPRCPRAVRRVLGTAATGAACGLVLAALGAVPTRAATAPHARGADRVAPRPSLRIVTPDLATLERTGHLVVRVALDERGNGALVARLDPGAMRTSVVEHGYPRAGRVTYALRLSRRARRLLAGRDHIDVVVTLAVEDMAGNRRRRHRHATLRR